MTTIEKSALVPYSAEQMYTLVNEVALYPEFIPWCAKTHVLEESKAAMVATLVLAQSGMEQAFTTHNTLVPFSTITMHLKEGPFKTLEGIWKFEARAEGGCQVSFHLDFEFSSKMMAMLFGPVFEKAASKLVDCFCERAEDLHAKKPC